MSDGEAQAQLLEQFTLLAKSLKGRAVVGVIQQALASKKIFVFGELLAMPNVVALQGTEHEAYYKLLELFCFGRCSDYRAASLPALTEAQAHKLRLLSVVSLCREHRELNYDVVASEIGAETTRELEDVLIDAMYLGLVSGKMDQRMRIFKVARAASRDVRLSDVATLTTHLQKWAETASNLAAALDRNNKIGIQTRQQEADHASAFNSAVDELKKELKDQQAQQSSAGGSSSSVYDYLGTDVRSGGPATASGTGQRRVKRSRVPVFK